MFVTNEIRHKDLSPLETDPFLFAVFTVPVLLSK